MGVAKAFWAVILLLFTSSRSVSDELIHEAHQRWLKATCVHPKYTTIRFVPDPLHCFGTDVEYAGCFIRETGEILLAGYLLEWKNRERLRQVLAHEMGHSLIHATYHVPDHAGIMTVSVVDSLFVITKADIASVCDGRKEPCLCRRPE